MTTGITGITYCKNAISQGYCIEETIRSLLLVSDEVVVVDSGSDDGTQELIDSIDPRVRRIHHPFDLPTQGHRWVLKCINAGRMAARNSFVFQLDADEILHPADHDVVTEHVWSGRPAWCWRHNLWRNASTELREGCVVGSGVVRLAPSSYWLPSDEPRIPEPPVRVDAIHPQMKDRKIRIIHYGFIRSIQTLVAKSRLMTSAYTGTPDARLDAFLTKGVDAYDDFVSPIDLRSYNEGHPELMHKWLRANGHQV